MRIVADRRSEKPAAWPLAGRRRRGLAWARVRLVRGVGCEARAREPRSQALGSGLSGRSSFRYVVVQVKSIAEMGAYVSLLEYNGIEGMILLSELSRRRIRSVSKLIKARRLHTLFLPVSPQCGVVACSFLCGSVPPRRTCMRPQYHTRLPLD